MYLINRLGEGFLSMWGGFSHEYTEGRPFLTRSDAEQAREGEHDLVVYIPAMLDGMPINERDTVMNAEWLHLEYVTLPNGEIKELATAEDYYGPFSGGEYDANDEYSEADFQQ